MRRSVYFGLGLSALLLGVFLFSSNMDYYDFIAPSKRLSHSVALLPICNPGTACDPDLPKKLDYSFFKHTSGVARHLKRVSNEQIIIKGKTISWLRAQRKLKSLSDVINHVPELLSMASTQLNLSDYDIFILYLNTPGLTQSISWPKGQIINVDHAELSPGLGIMLNPTLHTNIDPHDRTSAILPGTSWVQRLLQILGFSDLDEQLCH